MEDYGLILESTTDASEGTESNKLMIKLLKSA